MLALFVHVHGEECSTDVVPPQHSVTPQWEEKAEPQKSKFVSGTFHRLFRLTTDERWTLTRSGKTSNTDSKAPPILLRWGVRGGWRGSKLHSSATFTQVNLLTRKIKSVDKETKVNKGRFAVERDWLPSLQCKNGVKQLAVR